VWVAKRVVQHWTDARAAYVCRTHLVNPLRTDGVHRGMPSGIIPASGPFGSRPVFGTDDLTTLGYPGLTDPRFTRLSGAIQPLVLPTNRKQLYFDTNLGRQWETFWSRMWRSAKWALQTSERIVVCGYGMYPIDRRGRDLLLRGKLEGDIEICCGSNSSVRLFPAFAWLLDVCY
jgi:hypothetical protein